MAENHNQARWTLEILERIAKLEQECESLRRQGATAVASNTLSVSPGDIQENYSPLYSSNAGSVTHPREEQVFQGGTSLNQPIAILNRTVDNGPNETAQGSPEANGRVGAIDLHQQRHMDPKTSPQCCYKLDLAKWCKEARNCEMTATLREVFRIFFMYLNPHYPCINENQFFGQFETYVLTDNCNYDDVAPIEFIALVNFIIAEVKTLNNQCTDSTFIPGWKDFCLAEHLLSHTTWLGDGSLVTIQCLLIKSSFLLYIGKGNAAYDTLGRAVRLCFQIGLHNEPSWGDLDDFDKTMKQRIFWSLFYLDRNVALNSGAPYVLREFDFNVSLPICIDDRSLFPSRPLPEEDPENSFIPYMHCVIKWGRLCSEIRDAMFGVCDEANQSGICGVN